MEQNSDTLAAIMDKFRIPIEGDLRQLANASDTTLLDRITQYIKERKSCSAPVDLDFITSLVSALSSFDDVETAALNGTISELLHLISLANVKGKSLCKLFDLMRTGTTTINSDKNDITRIPAVFHYNILSTLEQNVKCSNPPHISLPGDKDSYMQVSAIPLPQDRAYTVAMWVKLADNSTMKGFLLYRCRSATSGIDAIISAVPNGEATTAGVWNLTIRSSCEKKQQRDEVTCKVKLTLGAWHLITVQQAAMRDGADRVSVAVDGVSSLEAELLYPFTVSASDSIWIFGLGMKGLVSSIALYPVDLHETVLQLLHSFGPQVSSLTAGARCPQSSFDTGHLILGTLSAKGVVATKLCQYSPIFSVNALRVGPDARSPLITPGVLYPDHVDLQPRFAEHDEPLYVTLTGGGTVCVDSCGVDSWQEAGGCSLVLYLFWTYCEVKIPSAFSNAPTPESLRTLELVSKNLRAVLSLLAVLVASSTDFKEQFIQIHGFHVIGYCLSTLPEAMKRRVIDDSLVDQCFNLVRALGPDASKGDAISAALQGLLFDFRIWGSCELSSLKHFLQQLTTLVLELGQLMYKSVGVQRILDIFRLHIARKLPTSSTGASAADRKIVAESTEEYGIECADCVHRLLIISMEAAMLFATKVKANVMPEAEALLKCLEETSSVVIAERILRIIGNLRYQAPVSLRQAMSSVRYNDTAILPLLTRKGFSLEVRSSALCNLLWAQAEDVKSLPAQIIPLRKSLNQAIAALAPNGAPASHRKSVSMADSSRTKMLIEQLNDLVKPLERVWSNNLMLAEVVDHALGDGSWGKVQPSVFLTGLPVVSNVAQADLLEYVAPAGSAPLAVTTPSLVDISSVIRTVTHTGQYEAWMLLPLLPALLSRVDLNTSCNVLVSLNVLFKTDETQCEALSCVPTGSWLRVMLSLAALGEKVAMTTSTTDSAATPSASESDTSVSSTIAELALDCISIILEYKSRTQLQESRSMWTTLQSVIKSTCASQFSSDPRVAEEIELSFLRRIVSLLLHRIANNPEAWVPNLINRAVHIFSLVESRKLTGVSPSRSPTPTITEPASTDLLNLDFDEAVKVDRLAKESEWQTQRFKSKATQESNIMYFLFDITTSLRRSAERGALQGQEWRALRIALRITLESLDVASERIADKIMQEVLAQIKYISERWAPLTGNGFKSLLMIILNALRSSINNPTTPEYLKGRYTALVFGIMHSFIEIRHFISSGGAMSQQVFPALDALMGIDSCNDIHLIFKLLDVTMRRADAISFEEVEMQDDDSPRSGDSISNSESYLALHREKFTPDDDNLVKITPDGEPSEYADLPSTGEQDSNSSEPPNFLSDDVSVITQSSVGDTALSSSKAPVPFKPSQLDGTGGRELQYRAWLKVRQGISSERVDSERARLARSMDTLDLTSEATKKFWKKARRKVESESFLQAHTCQWKLGVAHEGHFYGRRRIVLRPRFDSHYGHVVDHSRVHEGADFPMGTAASTAADITASSDQLNRALAKACAGYIKDVTRAEAPIEEKDPTQTKTGPGVSGAGVNNANAANGGVPVPGSGWGLVDADGSEEGGFGVVGIAAAADATPPAPEDAASEPHNDNSPLPDDMLGDVRQMEENYRQGKGTETGPCHSGTRRVGSGPALLDTRVILITASGNFWGSLSFNGKEIFFASSFEAEDGHKDDSAAVNLVKQRRMRRRRWVLSSVSGIYLRRFRLRDSALEVFFRKGKHRNFFVDFGHTKDNARQRNEFARALMSAAPATAFKQVPSMSVQRLVYEHKVQEKWLEGKMSNFDYLMALNTLAGRSYNDLCQYPVFPWVISDYTSASIDLTDASVYRDLSKPMGALNEHRLGEFLDRFNTFEDNISSGIPAFMYGSHYSTMVGVVLHFLVRLQPFAALHKEMQNGHFDVPDRLFSSIPRSFKHNTTQLSEVKELTPEWFTTPDMFRNVNNFALGQTQDGDHVGDVELPPWAATPEEFVRINRAALESDYVTTHLHEWIDLIFGYKQRGPDAVEANNVFYYLTYYGSVNHYMIKDEALRRATELQIAHFGQTPMQLFKVPHPARKLSGRESSVPVPRPLRRCFDDVTLMEARETARSSNTLLSMNMLSEPNEAVNTLVKPVGDEELIASQAPCTMIKNISASRVVKAEIFTDRVVCVLENGVLEILKFGTSEAAKSALAFSASLPKNKPRSSTKSGMAGSSKGTMEQRHSLDIINVDELYDPFGDLQREQELREAQISDTGSQSSVSDGNESPAPVSQVVQLLRPDEYLIHLERECTHFDVIPRVPLTKAYSVDWSNDFIFPETFKVDATHSAQLLSLSAVQQVAASIIFNRNCSLMITGGHTDGRVAVREIDSRTGFVKASADFLAHRRRVVALSSDAIPSGNTDVMATCDEAGIVMVWTILRTKNLQQLNGVGYVISRRPQRMFRVDPQPDMHLEISWQMGVIVVTSGTKVCVFSIERDELVHAFHVNLEPTIVTETHVSEGFEGDPVVEGNGTSSTGPEENLFANKKRNGLEWSAHKARQGQTVSRRMALCDFGVVIVHTETFEPPAEGSATTGSEVQSKHSIVCTTVSGQRCGLLQCDSPVSFMSCPDHSEYLLLGYADGTVQIRCALSLELFHTIKPHLFAIGCPLFSVTRDGASVSAQQLQQQAKAEANRRRSMESAALRRSSAASSSSSMSMDVSMSGSRHRDPSLGPDGEPLPVVTVHEASPVTCVSLGPNRAAPTMMCVLTESGQMYFYALPDFVKWERTRTLSTLQQLAAAPLQAVKGTIMQAQNWTQETAGVLAQNARTLADELGKSKLAKGVAGLFGFGRK